MPINQVNPGSPSLRGRFRCTSIDPVIPAEREKSRDDGREKSPGSNKRVNVATSNRPFVASSQPLLRGQQFELTHGREGCGRGLEFCSGYLFCSTIANSPRTG